MKISRIRIQVDVEVDVPEAYFEEHESAQFFYEENHCVENETIRALDLLKEAGDLATEFHQRKHKAHGGVCVTCHGATVTLLSFRDATGIEAAVAADREAAARAERTTEEKLRLALGALEWLTGTQEGPWDRTFAYQKAVALLPTDRAERDALAGEWRDYVNALDPILKATGGKKT